MRKKHEPQTNIFDFINIVDHSISRELVSISNRLDEHPEFLDWVYEDIKKKVELVNPETGRPGITADSVLRCHFIKSYTNFTYRELDFYLQDSLSFKTFARLYDFSPDYSTLQKNIGAISDGTIEKINRTILLDARNENYEKGRVVRTDSTTCQTNIHAPKDSRLLWDTVRVLTRLLHQLDDKNGKRMVPYKDHTRVCKRLSYKLQFACGKKKRLPFYKKLLMYTRNAMSYTADAIMFLESDHATREMMQPWLNDVKNYLALGEKVISQTERRVLHNEKVPSRDKVFSLFEPHTDVIVKGSRDVVFGHKINLTTGQSGLVLDMVIEKGNPADSSRAVPMIERQIEIYGRSPRQATFDGGYATKANLKEVKGLGVKDVAFCKKRGLLVAEMVKSTWVYKKLIAFRAGIEGNIGTLKSRYGFNRVNWKGFPRFQAFLWGSVLAYNLVTLARLELKPK